MRVLLRNMATAAMVAVVSAALARAAPGNPPEAETPEPPPEKVVQAVERAVCRVTVENAWGIPVAVTDGFLLGDGRFVVTNLGPVAQEGAARAEVAFSTGKPLAATQFGLADGSLGIVVLRLPGKGAGRPGLKLASRLPPLEEMGEVFTVQRGQAAVVDLLSAWMQKGPVITRPAAEPSTAAESSTNPSAAAETDGDGGEAAVSPSPEAAPAAGPAGAAPPEPASPPAEEHFFRIEKGVASRLPGLPVVDRQGAVVAVVSDMVTRDSVLIGVPGPVLHTALLASETSLKDFDALPKARWCGPIVRFTGAAPSLETFSQTLVSTKSRLICPMCGGKGLLPREDGSTPTGDRRPIQRGRYLPRCPACGGSGVVVESGLMKMLGTMAEQGARIVWSAEGESRSRRAVRQGLLEILRTLATSPPRARQLFATYAGRQVSRSARQTPTGLIAYAQVREMAEGPDGRYLMLEPWQSSTTIALRLKDLVSAAPSASYGAMNHPPVGRWTFLAGMVLSDFETDLRQGVYVLPVVLIPAPVTY